MHQFHVHSGEKAATFGDTASLLAHLDAVLGTTDWWLPNEHVLPSSLPSIAAVQRPARRLGVGVRSLCRYETDADMARFLLHPHHLAQLGFATPQKSSRSL
jgi:hypothetical protein